MLKDCKTKEFQNKLQRLQKKQRGNEEDCAKDGENMLNVMRIKTGRQCSENFGNWEILLWKPECTKLLRLRGEGRGGGGRGEEGEGRGGGGRGGGGGKRRTTIAENHVRLFKLTFRSDVFLTTGLT